MNNDGPFLIWHSVRNSLVMTSHFTDAQAPNIARLDIAIVTVTILVIIIITTVVTILAILVIAVINILIVATVIILLLLLIDIARILLIITITCTPIIITQVVKKCYHFLSMR